jgi:phosphonopyruvate decarboxylase
MLETTAIGNRLKELGYSLYSGVPCSFLNDLINYAINHTRYVGAANEGDAVAICAGAYLGGAKSVVLMQNSGLANAVSPLTSLNAICGLPVLAFVSLRGEPGLHDEPQHELMGEITTRLLDEMRVHWEYLATGEPEAARQLRRADAYIEKRESFFFVVRKGSFTNTALQRPPVTVSPDRILGRLPASDGPLPSRAEIIEALLEVRGPECAFVAATGYTARELYDTADLDANFYMVGSMGCASSIALGLALVRPDMRFVCLDGDGAALMRLGALATNGFHAPPNLLHVLLDNGCHESTGGQATVSSNVAWPALASAAGYPRAERCSGTAALRLAWKEWERLAVATFLHVPTRRGTRPNLSRPAVCPRDVASRFRRFVCGTADATRGRG